MKLSAFAIILSVQLLFGCGNKNDYGHDLVIAAGQMPNVAKDRNTNFHIVYGSGDSILYTFSDNQGNSFSASSLVAVLPKLAASHMRGPQVAATENGLIAIACNDMGDIFSFVKDQSGKWSQTTKVNDVDTVAKENLIALDAEGKTAFAIWLDLRDKHNKIYGAKSDDEGNTWSKNFLIYSSPDSTVCECCKPSVKVKGNSIYVMFRNWLNGNRDLYLIQSSDGGVTFGQARKLGNGSWALKGCPMDGGGIVIDKNSQPQTVWSRKSAIYACEPGKEEIEIGRGKGCTIESVKGKNIYAWAENGDIVVLDSQRKKQILGKGQQPILKTVDDKRILCVWEHDKTIHCSIVEL